MPKIKKKISKKSKPPARGKLVELKVSPSRAYIATECMQWQNISSGKDLLTVPKNQLDGIDKHAKIERDISVVKNWLPENYKQLDVLQEKELRAEIKHLNFFLKVSGKADCVIYDSKNFILRIFDWKTGHSQVNEISEEQLVLYAIAAMSDYPKTKSIELVYVNPDIGTSFTLFLTLDELDKKVKSIIERIGEKISKGFKVGLHCEYCPARSACPELKKQLKLLVDPEYNSKPIELFSEDYLDVLKIAEKVIKEQKDRLKTYLTFHPDKSVKGYTLTYRKGERTIAEIVDVNELAEKLGTDLDNLYERKLKSVKRLEDDGLAIDKIQDYISQPLQKVLKKL